jgi:hypothetical protein
MADSRLHSQPQISATAIEPHFRAGEVQCEMDEVEGKKTDSPYLPDTAENHWWTRGYAHMARALRAVELQAKLAEANARAEAAEKEAATINECLLTADARAGAAEKGLRLVAEWLLSQKRAVVSTGEIVYDWDSRNELYRDVCLIVHPGRVKQQPSNEPWPALEGAKRAIAEHEAKWKRGQAWCRVCGKDEPLLRGEDRLPWHCGHVMTLDSPEEREVGK